MRSITPQTMNAWLSGDFTGSQRAMQRATVAPLQAKTFPYKTQVFCTTVWSQNARPRELPNIKSISWNRALDQDAATCTLVLYNTEPLPLGTPPATDDDFDLPGFYTYNRGRTTWSTTRWNQEATGWHDQLVPDRVIRTYEGYGFDPTVMPEADPHMYLSGVWLIDTVEYTSDGLITVTCRDLARILMDQIMFVPVVPLKHYPISFTKNHPVDNPDITTTTGATVWKHPAFSDSSTTPYVGLNGAVHGHRGTHAFDTSLSTYWLSTGNGTPSADYSFEWIEGKIASATVSSVKFKVWGGPYRVYISVYSNGKWRGDHTIPYNPNDPVSSPNGANIRFISAFSVGDGSTKTYTFRNPWTHVTKIRLTFTHLYNSGIGPYVYRAGCRDFQIAEGSTVTTTKDGGSHTEGNYGDFTDIAKLILSYGGFWWPPGTKLASRRLTDGSVLHSPPPSNDPYLKSGRVWGDMMNTGTAGTVPLDVQIFDKKPLLDCVLGSVPVKTDRGYTRADEIELGDTVANRGGYGTVIGRKREAHDEIVEATINGETFITSRGHLYWTQRGWVRAEDLQSGEEVRTHAADLRLVRDHLYGDVDAGGTAQDLFRVVSSAAGREIENQVPGAVLSAVRRDVQARPIREEVLLPAVRICRPEDADTPTVRDMPGDLHPEGVNSAVLLRGVPAATHGEARMGRPLRGAVRALAGLGRRLASRALALPAWVSARTGVDQGGLGERDLPDSDRSRRPVTPRALASSAGRNSRPVAQVHRVDSVAIHRRGDPQWSRFCDRDGDVYLYDLSVSGDPSFVIGESELVVHNCLTYIKDLVGFTFFVDETGGAVWRLPNVWRVGNIYGDGDPKAGRSTDVHEIDERTTLMNLTATLSSHNVREKIFVANVAGRVGAVAPGFNPYPSGLRRVAGWTDQNFTKTKECQIMADMIAVRQMYSYRTDKVVIAGNPSMQMDDQVRIYERVTNEGYLHYISGIQSDWDLETGKWTYTLSTNWLGVTPFTNWVIDPSKLAADTKMFLSSLTGVPIG